MSDLGHGGSPQLDMFTMDAVMRSYAGRGDVDNAQLYEDVAARLGVAAEALDHREPIGQTGQRHSVAKRRVRWIQQTAKRLGLLQRVPGKRGTWRLTGEGEKHVGIAPPGVALVAFSTELGIAIWGRWESVFPKLDETVHLLLTSPPYCISKGRAYGKVSEADYVDFVCRAIEPILRNLAPGGSVALNVSPDIYERGFPSRSLYVERLILAIHERFGLSLMDRLIWNRTSAPPGPMQYASGTRQQLNQSYEFVLWFTNNPKLCFSDNRRVLEPHTEKHLRLMQRGGEQRERVNSDGAYRVRHGSYGTVTEGKIPRNVISLGHYDKESQMCNAYAKREGLQPHGAPMPLALADRLVRFLTREGDLVVDPFAGRLTTGRAAEKNNRRWICTEMIGDHLMSGRQRFAA